MSTLRAGLACRRPHRSQPPGVARLDGVDGVRMSASGHRALAVQVCTLPPDDG